MKYKQRYRKSCMNYEKFAEQKRFKNKEIVLMLIKYIIFVSRRTYIQPYTKGNVINLANMLKGIGLGGVNHG